MITDHSVASAQRECAAHWNHARAHCNCVCMTWVLVRRSASIMGEYRGIMNLCRVLPNGPDAKLAVDNAIDLASSIGNLRNDIVR